MGNPVEPNLKPDPVTKDSFLGVPLKGWAVAALSLLAVCAAGAHYAIRLYGEWQEQKTKLEQANTLAKTSTEERNKLSAINDVTSKNTDLITAEIKKHKTDHSGHQFPMHTDSMGNTIATYFESDGCISIVRPGQKLPYLDHPEDYVEWSLGPGLKPNTPGPELPGPPAAASADGKSPTASREAKSRSLQTALDGYNSDSRVLGRPRLLKAQAGCLNPHPWPFQSWWGSANGCFAPLYRKWNDGCTHYQMYNSCSGQWDPKIFWTYCNPNHHQ